MILDSGLLFFGPPCIIIRHNIVDRVLRHRPHNSPTKAALSHDMLQGLKTTISTDDYHHPKKKAQSF